jgi:hypothetical protein
MPAQGGAERGTGSRPGAGHSDLPQSIAIMTDEKTPEPDDIPDTPPTEPPPVPIEEPPPPPDSQGPYITGTPAHPSAC